MWKSLLPCLACLFSFGCVEDADTIAACGADCGSTPDYLSDCSADEGDPLDILEGASLEGETLTVSVTYSGGCEAHDYVLCLPAGGFSEGIPVGARLDIWHDAAGDYCEAVETETLTFDISSLVDDYIDQYGPEGTLRISIGSDQLDYVL